MGLPHLPLRQAHFLLYWKGSFPLGRRMFLAAKRISWCCAPAFFSLRKGWAGQQSPAFACVLAELCGSLTGMSECLQKDGGDSRSAVQSCWQRAAIACAACCDCSRSVLQSSYEALVCASKAFGWPSEGCVCASKGCKRRFHQYLDKSFCGAGRNYEQW